MTRSTHRSLDGATYPMLRPRKTGLGPWLRLWSIFILSVLFVGVCAYRYDSAREVRKVKDDIKSAVAAGEKWLRDGSLSDAKALLANLNQTLASKYARVPQVSSNELAAASQVLLKVKKRCAQLEADSQLQLVQQSLDVLDSARAKTLLMSILSKPDAAATSRAEQLLREIDEATSDESANAALLKLSDIEFEAFQEHRAPAQQSSAHGAIAQLRLITLRRNQDAVAITRRALAERRAERAQPKRIKQPPEIGAEDVGHFLLVKGYIFLESVSDQSKLEIDFVSEPNWPHSSLIGPEKATTANELLSNPNQKTFVYKSLGMDPQFAHYRDRRNAFVSDSRNTFVLPAQVRDWLLENARQVKTTFDGRREEFVGPLVAKSRSRIDRLISTGEMALAESVAENVREMQDPKNSLRVDVLFRVNLFVFVQATDVTSDRMVEYEIFVSTDNGLGKVRREMKDTRMTYAATIYGIDIAAAEAAVRLKGDQFTVSPTILVPTGLSTRHIFEDLPAAPSAKSDDSQNARSFEQRIKDIPQGELNRIIRDRGGSSFEQKMNSADYERRVRVWADQFGCSEAFVRQHTSFNDSASEGNSKLVQAWVRKKAVP